MARNRAFVAPALLGYLGLAWMGGASVAVAESPAGMSIYGFNDPVDFGELWSDMLAVPVGDVVGASVNSLTLPFTSVLMLGLVVALVLHLWFWTAASRRALLGAALVGAPYGLLGLALLPGPYDGEWMGEGWPVLQVFGLWWIVVAAVAIRSLLSANTAGPVVAASVGRHGQPTG